MLDSMDAVARTYPLLESFCAVSFVVVVIEHEIHTSLVKSHRVEARKYAYVIHLGIRRAGTTVAVYRKIIHHVDI